jgi:hypothetical protein
MLILHDPGAVLILQDAIVASGSNAAVTGGGSAGTGTGVLCGRSGLRLGRRSDENQSSEEYASGHENVIQTPARSAGIILHLRLERAFTPKRAGKFGFSRISEFVLPDTIAVNRFESSFRSGLRARINSIAGRRLASRAYYPLPDENLRYSCIHKDERIISPVRGPSNDFQRAQENSAAVRLPAR